MVVAKQHVSDRQNLWAHLWNSICWYRFWEGAILLYSDSDAFVIFLEDFL